MAPGAALSLPSRARTRLDEAAKLPQSQNKVALQVVPVQLRAWVVDQRDVICRPYYILVLELYPRGKVLNARMHNPASRRPDAAALAAMLADHMADPPAGEPRQRPTHVSFVEPALVSACAPLLARLQIAGGELTLADGVAEYVSSFSDKLVSLGRASRGDSAEQPGLLSVRGMEERAVRAFMDAAVGMCRAAPWKAVHENIALEVLVPGPPGPRPRKLRYYVSVLGSGENVVGFAVMAKLESIRAKFRRSRDGAGLEEQPPAAGELLCANCGRRVGEDTEEDGGRYVYRCGKCKRLLYCDENCQMLDWGARHRDECEQAAKDKDFVFQREAWGWLLREMALLFVDPTSVPFDDLDAADEHGWPYMKNQTPSLHPTAFVTVDNPAGAAARRVERPTPEELRVLTLLAEALTGCRAPPPGGGELMLPNGVVLKVAEDLATLIPKG